MTCPNCGAQSSGKFCSECGATLGPRACPKCGAQLSARAKFCPECGFAVAPKGAAGAGAAVASGAGAAAATRMPWIVAGISLLALMAAIIVIVTRRPTPAGGAVGVGAEGTAAPFAQGGGRATTDISNMTPREAADRLFNRVMTAAENNDSQQVQFFGPMTLQAYANVQPLDADGHMHVGQIELILGNPAAARAEADTIASTSRTHLFASLLKARAAQQSGDRAATRQAWGQFLDNYDAERAKNLEEYREHDAMLSQARDVAKQLLNR